MRTEKIRLNRLKPHEEVVEDNLGKVIESIRSEKVLKEPIIVDSETKVILDGHHRYEAFKVLGERRIPCMLVDYMSDQIEVDHWKDGSITKKEVVEKGLSDELYSPKTSRHSIPSDVTTINYRIAHTS